MTHSATPLLEHLFIYESHPLSWLSVLPTDSLQRRSTGILSLVTHPTGEKTVHCFTLFNINFVHREIYEAKVWNEEIRFHSPMALGTDGTHLYAGEIVTFLHEDGTTIYAKVVTFAQQVCSITPNSVQCNKV